MFALPTPIVANPSATIIQPAAKNSWGKVTHVARREFGRGG